MSTIIKTFYETEINEDFQKEITELYSTDKNVVIYLCSGGGFSWVADSVIDMINRNAERTKLIAYGQISSSAFRIFMEAQCSKEILPNTYGMFHLSIRGITLNDKKQPHAPLDNFINNHLLDADYNTTLQLAEKWKLTQEEIDKLQKGEDVFFPYQRLVEISSPTLNSNKIKLFPTSLKREEIRPFVKLASNDNFMRVICDSKDTSDDIYNIVYNECGAIIHRPIPIEEIIKYPPNNNYNFIIYDVEAVLKKIIGSNIEAITITQ